MRYLIGFCLLATSAIANGQANPPTPAKAQKTPNPLSLSGSVRLRYEAVEGQPRVGFNDSDDLFNIRTILTAEYDAGPVRFGAELYDSRVYGSDAGTPVTTNEVNTLELVQTYLATDIDAPFGKGTKVGLQAGRFTLNLGSRRLVAADDYRNTTNGYTGLRANLQAGEGVTATLITIIHCRRCACPMTMWRFAITKSTSTAKVSIWFYGAG